MGWAGGSHATTELAGEDEHLCACCHSWPRWGFVWGFSCCGAGWEMRQGRQEGVLPTFPARMQQEQQAVVTRGFISGPGENRESVSSRRRKKQNLHRKS